MSIQRILIHGDTASLQAVTPALGQIGSNDTTKQVILGDGVTPGGIPMARQDALVAGLASKLDSNEGAIEGIKSINRGPLNGLRNKIINGNFDIWQRGTSQSTVGYSSDDRFINSHVGSTKTHSRQSFALGQTDVPGNPTYFSRTVVSSVAGASNFCNKNQKIEDVRTLSGRTATLTFYARADASKNMVVEFTQSFGTGGSPSADVNGIGVTTIPLTPNWTRYDVPVNVPSIVGKTLGNNNNSYLLMTFWFDAGSSFNSRTNGLGQQSGTFDIAHVSLVEGDATAEDDPFSPRHIQQEMALCQRYYEVTGPIQLYLIDNGYSGNYIPFKIQKQATPSISRTPISADAAIIAQTIDNISAYGFRYIVQGTGQANAASTFSIDSEL